MTEADGHHTTVHRTWWGHLLWVFSGAVLGMTVAAVFVEAFRLPRNVYLVPYVVLVGAFLCGYFRWSRPDLKRLIGHRWAWGLIAGVVVGFFAVHSVLRQPSSPTPQALELAFDLLWLGFVYGAVDGLLLSVLPVFAVWEAMTTLGWTARWPGRTGAGALALTASLAVTALYHLGYPEFRGPQVMLPVFGVGMMSLAYLVSGKRMSASSAPHSDARHGRASWSAERCATPAP